MLLGYPVLGIWYWCTDQTIVQRVLAAKSEHDAQIGPLFAGFLKVLPVFILVLPGTIGYVLFQDRIGEDANQVLPILITELIPTGLKGLISAGLAGGFDEHHRRRAQQLRDACGGRYCHPSSPRDVGRNASPHRPLGRRRHHVGRHGLVDPRGRFTSIFEAVQVIAADLAPPITAVFVWGVFWRRGTEQASLATLIFGLALGVIAFTVDMPLIGDEKLITDVWGVPFMLQAWWGFVMCSVVFVVVSLLTPPPPPEKIEGLTWDNPLAVLTHKIDSDRIDPRFVAAGLMATLIVVYVVLA